MVRMDDIIYASAYLTGNGSHKVYLERPFRRSHDLRDLIRLYLRLELPASRPHQLGIYTQLAESGDQLDTLIVRSTAAKHRIEMEHTHRLSLSPLVKP